MIKFGRHFEAKLLVTSNEHTFYFTQCRSPLPHTADIVRRETATMHLPSSLRRKL